MNKMQKKKKRHCASATWKAPWKIAGVSPLQTLLLPPSLLPATYNGWSSNSHCGLLSLRIKVICYDGRARREQIVFLPCRFSLHFALFTPALLLHGERNKCFLLSHYYYFILVFCHMQSNQILVIWFIIWQIGIGRLYACFSKYNIW